MSLKLEPGRIAGGVWIAEVTGAAEAPVIEAVTGAGPSTEWRCCRARAGAIRSGCRSRPGHSTRVQTVLVRSGGETLAQFTLIAGEPADQDIRAELGLLRAELDLLKRAFQRHAREG
jgi:hypothetical protein